MLQAASCEVAEALTNKIVGNLPFVLSSSSSLQGIAKMNFVSALASFVGSPLRCIHRQQKTSIAKDFQGAVLMCHIPALDCT